MNTVFFIFLTLSLCALLFTAPEEILPALTVGTQGAVTLCLTLTATFALWGGFLEIAKNTGVQTGLGKRLKKPLSLLVGKTDGETAEALATNLSANFLGLGAIATPAGITAVQKMKAHAGSNSALFERQTGCLLILNCCCMQLLPTSVISMRLSLGSAAPSDIWVPTLLTGLCSTLSAVAVCLVWNAFAKRREGKTLSVKSPSYPQKLPLTAQGGKSGNA